MRKTISMPLYAALIFCGMMLSSDTGWAKLEHSTELAKQVQGNKGKRLVLRLAQILGFKTANRPLRHKQASKVLPTLLTTAVACTLFSCSAVKPHLYSIGLLNPSSAMQAQTITTAVLAAQRDFDHGGEGMATIDNHVYVVRTVEHEHKTILAEVVKAEERGNTTLRTYVDKYELTIDPNIIEGYLIDDHPHVGRVVKLTSDAVGISHLNGNVFAVYDNGIHAINITSKTDLDGQREELHAKDDAPHIRFAYEDQLQ